MVFKALAAKILIIRSILNVYLSVYLFLSVPISNFAGETWWNQVTKKLPLGKKSNALTWWCCSYLQDMGPMMPHVSLECYSNASHFMGCAMAFYSYRMLSLLDFGLFDELHDLLIIRLGLKSLNHTGQGSNLKQLKGSKIIARECKRSMRKKLSAEKSRTMNFDNTSWPWSAKSVYPPDQPLVRYCPWFFMKVFTHYLHLYIYIYYYITGCKRNWTAKQWIDHLK